MNKKYIDEEKARALHANGEWVEAIKVLRNANIAPGFGLKEARDVVQSWGPLQSQKLSLPVMTLRDYFAGQALSAIAKDYMYNNPHVDEAKVCAQQSYRIADAMLEARK